MFEDIEAVLHYIEQKTNFKLGLFRVEAFLKEAVIPYQNLKYVHVGGTNGKGSVTFYLSNILINSGYKTGMFSSPSLEGHNDRIRVNNQFISDEAIISFVNKYYDLIEKTQLTMFEIDVVMALAYFCEQEVDIAVLEVGMGGAFDGTNVIKPLVSVITNIGLEHIQYLGDTKEAIAQTKSGIIKEHSFVVTAEQDRACLAIIKKMAQTKHSKVIEVKAAEVISLNPIIFNYATYQHLELKSLANYQIANVACVLEVIKILNNDYHFNITEQAMRMTLLNVVWPGRFEIISRQPLIVIDGAHNEEGIKELILTLGKFKDYRKTIMFAALTDKPTDKMVEMLIATGSEVIITEFDFYRTKKAAEINKNFKLKVVKDYKRYIATKREVMENDEMLIITGSLYFITIIRKFLLEGAAF